MNLPPFKKIKEKELKIKTIDPNHICDLALDIWRLKKRIIKLKEHKESELLKPILYYIESCERTLINMGVETKDDYTGNIYRSSMNVDVVTYETINMDGDEAMVKETLVPAILIQNELLQKAKVVIVTPKV